LFENAQGSYEGILSAVLSKMHIIPKRKKGKNRKKSKQQAAIDSCLLFFK
jgi:hypothetical protein